MAVVLPRKSLKVEGRANWLLTSSNFLSWRARVDALGGLRPFQPCLDDTSFTGKIRRPDWWWGRRAAALSALRPKDRMRLAIDFCEGQHPLNGVTLLFV